MFRTSRRWLNYFLIGPPGSGKSSIAAALARNRKEYRHVDTDRDILEAEWKISVSQKLDEVGNEKFVELESHATRKFLEENLTLGKFCASACSISCKCNSKSFRDEFVCQLEWEQHDVSRSL